MIDKKFEKVKQGASLCARAVSIYAIDIYASLFFFLILRNSYRSTEGSLNIEVYKKDD